MNEINIQEKKSYKFIILKFWVESDVKSLQYNLTYEWDSPYFLDYV